MRVHTILRIEKLCKLYNLVHNTHYSVRVVSTHRVDSVANEVVAAHVEAEVGRGVRRVREEREEREAPLVRHADAVVEEQARHLRRRPKHEVVLCITSALCLMFQ